MPVESGQDLPLLDPISLLDRELGDDDHGTGRTREPRDAVPRLDAAEGRHRGVVGQGRMEGKPDETERESERAAWRPGA